MNEQQYSLVIAIMKRGFSDVAIKAARLAGAKGGTILTGRGTGGLEAERWLGVAIEPEKDILLILAEKEKRQEILKAVYAAAGLATEGNGLSFALPVEQVIGVSDFSVDDN